MTTISKVILIFLSIQFLSGCMAAGTLVGGALQGVILEKVAAKSAEVKPPKYIEISQEGRIITAAFEIKGFALGNKKASQMRGFHQWATAAVVREAPKRGCVNVINAYSANQASSTSSTIGDTQIASNLKFKCLGKETIASEQDLLADKLVIYKEQITFIDQNLEMIRYAGE